MKGNGMWSITMDEDHGRRSVPTRRDESEPMTTENIVARVRLIRAEKRLRER